MKIWASIAIYAALLITALIYREELTLWVTNDPPIYQLFIISIVFAVLPILPYKIIIAAISYAAGVQLGMLITLVGSTVAGILFYFGAAYIFRTTAKKWLATTKLFKGITTWIHEQPFKSILICKLLPIIPQNAINIYAGATAIPFGAYIAATIVGKLPGIIVYSYVGDKLLSSPIAAFSIMLIYMVIISLILWLYHKKNKITTQ
jgi:uncharacterized membrane protein YdjX (TVP38/TMEM64 family)